MSNCVWPHRRQPTRLPSLGFSRQEHWSGLPLPSPVYESEVAQSCPTLRDPMGCSLPGSSVHRTFQQRVLEWGAIAFSSYYTKRYQLLEKTGDVRPGTGKVQAISFCARKRGEHTHTSGLYHTHTEAGEKRG